MIFRNNVLVRKNAFVDTINANNASKIVTTNTHQNLTSVYKFNSQCMIYSDLIVHGLINGKISFCSLVFCLMLFLITGINISLWRNSLKMVSPGVQDIDNELHVLNNLTFMENVKSDKLIEDLNLTALAIEVEELRNNAFQMERNIIVISFYYFTSSFSNS